MDIKNTALLVKGDEPRFFYDEQDALADIMEFQSHNEPENRSVPEEYTGMITKDAEWGLIYRNREWLEEQFNELNGNAADRHNQEYEARYGD